MPVVYSFVIKTNSLIKMDVLCVILFAILYTFLYSNASDIRLYKGTSARTSPSFRHRRIEMISENEPLNIIFDGFFAKLLECKDETREFIQISQKDKNFYIFPNGTSVLKIPANEVTSHMNTKWVCLITNENGTTTEYSFVVKVRGAKAVRVHIGQIEQIFNVNNLHEAEYDGISEYMYEEGETIDWDCGISDVGILRLRYYDAQGTRVVDTQLTSPGKPLTFRQLMRAENSGSYLDCTYIIPNIQQEFTYRTVLTVATSPLRNDDFAVSVNDMKLTSKLYSTSGINEYQYKFIYGDTLTVSCEKNKKVPGRIELDITYAPAMKKLMNDIDSHYTIIEKTEKKYIFAINTMYLDQAHCKCYSKDASNFLGADIEFLADFDRGPTILGLSANDVLYQYRKNNNEWEVHYQYTVNKTVHLSCSTTKNEELLWTFENTHIRTSSSLNATVGIKYISRNFTFNSKHNGDTITCGAKREITTIILHQKTFIPPSYIEELLGTSTLMVIIGGATGVLVVIVVAVCLICWYSRNRPTTKIERPLENFSEFDNPIPAFPSQWENNECTHIKNEDGIYMENSAYYGSTQTQGLPHNPTTGCSGPAENHYTEIDDYYLNKNDKTNYHYSTPYDHRNIVINKPSIDNTYDILQRENDTNYAKIQGGDCNLDSIVLRVGCNDNCKFQQKDKFYTNLKSDKNSDYSNTKE